MERKKWRWNRWMVVMVARREGMRKREGTGLKGLKGKDMVVRFCVRERLCMREMLGSGK